MNVQGDLWATSVLWRDWRVFLADRYGVENPAQRQRARRIKYGVPGTSPCTSTKKTKTEGYFLKYFIEQIPDTTGYVMPIAL